MTRLLSEHQRERDAWAQMRRSFARQGRPTLARRALPWLLAAALVFTVGALAGAGF